MNMSTICLEAKLIETASAAQAEAHTCIALPKSVHKALATSGSEWIEGSLNGFPFRAHVESEGVQLCLSKAICEAAGVSAGDSSRLEITRVGDAPEVRVPAELHQALKASPTSLETWQAITPLARRDWVLWITTAKKPETRLSRIEKACDMLATGKKRVCCFPGLNWMTRDHVAADETWAPLPND